MGGGGGIQNNLNIVDSFRESPDGIFGGLNLDPGWSWGQSDIHCKIKETC